MEELYQKPASDLARVDFNNKNTIRTYRLDIAYEGTLYSGWQIQPNAKTIQEILEEKLSLILKSAVSIVGSGRTDAGVHARGQVAHFRIDREIDARKVFYSLNGLLPNDIRIISLKPACPAFHAQRSATGKEYHYTIVHGPVILPFDRHYAWHIFEPLDIELVQRSLPLFEGTHDFKAYANENMKGAASKNSVRTIYSLRYVEETPAKFRLEFHGSGFLYKMVRNITGMIISVALKKRPLEAITDAFLHLDRKAVDRAAPPQGLSLIRVDYPPHFL